MLYHLSPLPSLRRSGFVGFFGLLLLLQASATLDLQQHPQLTFEPNPSYLTTKDVILTFDDGPSWNNYTQAVLDVLKQKNVKATFFVNSGQGMAVEWTGPTTLQSMQRIINEGHTLGSHTRSHPHLGLLNSTELQKEIFGVEPEIRSYIPYCPRITLFRAPFGEPYQWQYQGDPQATPIYQNIANMVATKFVHIGWHFDSEDWKCPVDGVNGGPCLYQNVTSQLKAGRYGILLMHSVYERAAVGVGMIIDFLNANGYNILSVEDAVFNAYGATSAQIVDRQTTVTQPTTTAGTTTTSTAPPTTTTVTTTPAPAAPTTTTGANAAATTTTSATATGATTTLAGVTTANNNGSTIGALGLGSTTPGNGSAVTTTTPAAGSNGTLVGSTSTSTQAPAPSHECMQTVPPLATCAQTTMFVLPTSDNSGVNAGCSFVLSRTTDTNRLVIATIPITSKQTVPTFNYSPDREGEYRVMVMCPNATSGLTTFFDYCGSFYASVPSKRIVVRFMQRVPQAGEPRESFKVKFAKACAQAAHLRTDQIVNLNIQDGNNVVLAHPSSSNNNLRDASTTSPAGSADSSGFVITFVVLGSSLNETANDAANKVMVSASSADFNDKLAHTLGPDYSASSVAIEGGPQITPPIFRNSSSSSAAGWGKERQEGRAVSFLAVAAAVFGGMMWAAA